jgi:lysophospholipase L1-like esterase
MFLAAVLVALAFAQPSAQKPFEFKDGDRIVWIGNTFVEREQRYGYWETALLFANPDKKITLRNLGWSGDTVFGDARAAFDNAAKGFERLVSLTLELKPTVVFVSYGSNEAFEGEAGLAKFEKGLEKLLDALKPANARIVLFSPIPVSGNAPKTAERNAMLARYTEAISGIARNRGHHFANLTHIMDGEDSITDNRIHLNENGYKVCTPRFIASLGLDMRTLDWKELEPLRQAVIEKNQLFFYRWRPQNETYLFGFRKHEQGKNGKEVAEFDPLVGKAEDDIDKIRKQLK